MPLYEKKVELVYGSVYVAVFRNNERADFTTFAVWISREKAFKRAHAWADSLISDMKKWEENT